MSPNAVCLRSALQFVLCLLVSNSNGANSKLRHSLTTQLEMGPHRLSPTQYMICTFVFVGQPTTYLVRVSVETGKQSTFIVHLWQTASSERETSWRRWC
jgi:hypothetical protein